MAADEMRERLGRKAVKPDWLASMFRNVLTDPENDWLPDGAVVTQMPGDPQTLVIFQPGGDHLMVQVNRAEVVVS